MNYNSKNKIIDKIIGKTIKGVTNYFEGTTGELNNIVIEFTDNSYLDIKARIDNKKNSRLEISE